MGTPESQRDRSGAIALILLVAGMLASLPWVISRWYVPHNDAAMFVITARSILAGEGYSMLGEPFTIRPPGFSYMLAGALAVLGSDFHALNLFIGFWAVAAVAFLFLLVRPRLGLSVSLALCAAIWLAPGYLRFCSQLLSDIPGTAMMLGLLVFERRARRAAGPWPDAWLALGIGLSSLVRLIDVFVLPATLLARLVEEVRARGRPPGPRDPFWRRAALLVALPALVLLPWTWRNARVERSAPPEQHYVHSYSVGMWHTDPADPSSPILGPSDFTDRVGERLAELLPSLGSRLQGVRPGSSGVAQTGIALAGLLCCALVLARRREPCDFLVFALFGILAVYFAYQPRLAIPLLMLGLAAVADTLLWILRRFLPARVATGIVTLGLLTLLARDFRRPSWEAVRLGHEHLASACEYIERSIPEEQGLSARQGWHLSVLLDRPVWSTHMVMRREGAAGAVRMLDRHGVEVFVFQRGPGSRDLRQWREGLKSYFDVQAEQGGWAFALRNDRAPGPP